jgi:hypothetical protein
MTLKLRIFALVLAASNSYAGVVCYEYKYAPNLVRAAQSILKQQGFYHGPADGKWGSKTREAVYRFQAANKIIIARNRDGGYDLGELEPQTLKALFGDDAPTGVEHVANPHHAPQEFWNEMCR